MVRSPERQAETQTFIASSCSAPPKRVAIGIAPLGIVSIGIVPMGVVSIGVVPMGVVSLGVVGMGVLNACLVGMGVAVGSGVSMMAMAMAEEEAKMVAPSVVEKPSASRGFAASVTERR